MPTHRIHLRAIVIAAASVAAIVTLAPASAFAARPIDNEHSVFTTAPSADDWCGIDGTSITRGTEQYREDASGVFIDNVSTTTVFTATSSGKAMTIQQAGAARGYWVDNPDGSSTLYLTNVGLAPKFTLPTGQVILDTGVSGFAISFDANGNFTGFQFLYHHGPQPAACDAIVAALS